MKIKRANLYGVRLKLKEPFVVSYDTYEDMPVLLLRVETEDGAIGWGESLPDQHVTGETWESTYEIIKNELAPLLIGENPFSINKVHQQMDLKIYQAPSAKAAIDGALYDVMGQIIQQPTYKLLGGQSHEELTIPQEVSIDTPDKMAEQAEKHMLDHFKELKIKVGNDVSTDIKRIQQVHEALNDDVLLRVDANQGWSVQEAIQIIEQTKDCQVKYYEQPIQADNIRGLATTKQATNAPIMVDEGIHHMRDLLKIIELNAADYINLKLMKTGGIYPALAMTNVANQAGIKCHIGSMVESAIGTMAGAHLCLSQHGIQSNDLVGPLMLAEDVAGVNIVGNELQVIDSPGLGIDIDENFIKSHATMHAEIAE